MQWQTADDSCIMYRPERLTWALLSPPNYDSHASTKKIFCALFPSVEKCNETGWRIFLVGMTFSVTASTGDGLMRKLCDRWASRLCVELSLWCSLRFYFTRIATDAHVIPIAALYDVDLRSCNALGEFFCLFCQNKYGERFASIRYNYVNCSNYSL